jgi:hypothetical protein
MEYHQLIFKVDDVDDVVVDDDDDDEDNDDDDSDDDDDQHGSHIHLHIESPPTWHFKNTQPFHDSGAEQRQDCSGHVSSCFKVVVTNHQGRTSKT